LPTLLGQVDSAPSQEIELQPFVIVSQKEEQAAAIKDLVITSALQPAKVLIVDDEPAIRSMHHRVVRGELPAARISEASNGTAALEMIATEQPDLVLLDLMMPEMDGFEVLEKLKEVESARDTAVIVLTGKPLLDEDIVRLNQGVVKVLQKEVFTGDEIQSHVQSAIASGADVSIETKRVARKAMAYIHHHFAEPLSREELASLVGVSERHLNRCFRQELGVTPMTYLTRYRIRQAKRLLEQGQYSISQIALATGFSESSYFARVFRREVGLTAGAYKRGERLTQ
jgi:YesN/AraC family two-component response regulator